MGDWRVSSFFGNLSLSTLMSLTIWTTALADLQRAHVKLATLLFTKAERTQYRAQRLQITWLDGKRRAVERRAAKNARRNERAALQGMGALELDGDGEEDPTPRRSPLPEGDSMSLPIRTREMA